jgi:FlaA1/EpsC-like NDP-sugar epimerase
MISINNLNLEELINRKEIDISKMNELNYLQNKKILITGGLGSIGSEIVRQLIKLNFTNIIIYDNNECNYFYFKNEIITNCFFKNTKSSIKFILGSINDYNKLDEIFKNKDFDVVFHAAAYKHVPILEENEYEAIKVNIIGTKNLADLSLKYNVKKFIFVSTDKAVNSCNIMGCTKRISEIYLQYLWNNNNNKTEFIITRFGNVIGSSGSVLPKFIDYINKKNNILITHKDITRYFMTIPEASKLVILSSCIAKGGNLMLFDMGEPIKIVDIAKNLIKQLDIQNINIEFVGLRPGEKMYEELQTSNEELIPTKYDNIILLKNYYINYETFILKYNELVNLKYCDYFNINIRSILKKINPDYIYNE